VVLSLFIIGGALGGKIETNLKIFATPESGLKGFRQPSKTQKRASNKGFCRERL
jgi:hypothetical protein